MAWCTVVSQQSKEQLFREALQSHCSPRSYLQRQALNTVKARGTEKVPEKVHNQKGTENIPKRY